jgi:hypothetical protein
MKRIVCTEQTPSCPSGHIVAVGVTDGQDVAGDYMTVAQVYAAMGRREKFYTYGGGLWATVQPYDCRCGRGSLRSGADATTANNLDSLRLCGWVAA